MNAEFDTSDTVASWGGQEVVVLVLTARDVGGFSTNVHVTVQGAIDAAREAYRQERDAHPNKLSAEDERAAEERFARSLAEHGRASAGLTGFHLARRRIAP